MNKVKCDRCGKEFEVLSYNAGPEICNDCLQAMGVFTIGIGDMANVACDNRIAILEAENAKLKEDIASKNEAMKCSKCNDWGFIRKRRGISRKVDIIDCDCKGEASIEQLKHDKQAILEELGDCNKAYKSLEAENAKLKKIIEDDCFMEDEARKAAGDYDKSDSYGVEPLADIIERLVAELASKNEALEKINGISSLMLKMMKALEKK